MRDTTAPELLDADADEVPGRNWLDIALPIIVFVVFIGGWELLVGWFRIEPVVLPKPSAITISLWVGLISGGFPWHFLVTLTETITGFLVGATLGLVLGAIIGLSPMLERAFYPYIVAFQTVPKVAIAPLVIIWFGYGMASKVVITATIALFPVLANTIVGLRAVPKDELELMAAYTASRWQIFRMVRIPQALPYIFVSLDVAIVLSVIGAIVGEFVGSDKGLGYLILQMNFYLDMGSSFAILVLLSVMGVGLHMLMGWAERRVVFWRENSTDRVMGA